MMEYQQDIKKGPQPNTTLGRMLIIIVKNQMCVLSSDKCRKVIVKLSHFDEGSQIILALVDHSR